MGLLGSAVWLVGYVDCATLQASTVAGDITIDGNIASDGDETKTIFAEVATGTNTITLGGGGKVVAPDELEVQGASTLTGDATFGGDIVADADENKVIFA